VEEEPWQTEEKTKKVRSSDVKDGTQQIVNGLNSVRCLLHYEISYSRSYEDANYICPVVLHKCRGTHSEVNLPRHKSLANQLSRCHVERC